MSTPEFCQLIVYNRDYLSPYAISLTKDVEDARDLLQETMCRAIVNRQKYQPGTNIRAWLYTIMRNIFINDYRKKARKGYLAEPEMMERVAIINDAAVIVTAKEILLKISNLPSIFREPFQLYIDGFKYNEISQVLEEPMGTIKSRIHFARKLLKARISR